MKLVKSLIAATIMILVFVVAGVFFTTSADNIEDLSVEDAYVEDVMVDELVYPHDEVIDVNIDISETTYNTLIANATDSEYYSCNITYNGVTLENVAIRTKGNSSLRDVAQDNDDRFSFNIDLNYYIDQDLFGVDKLILNNLFKDSSMMAEFIGYEALDSLDAVSSRTTYTALYINNEYYGLYISVESVSNEYLDANYGNSDGELYKPEIGTGSTLDYVTSDGSYYTGLIDENSDDTSNEAIVALLQAIDTGENLDEIFNVDSFLKYLAVSTYTTHLDAYQGGMFHNYYLYNNEGTFEWISWDLNMIFNKFDGARMTDFQATEFLIDEPVLGSMSSYPLIEEIFEHEEYVTQYHEYLQELMDTYFDTDTFTARVIEIDNMINSYVQNDTNSFFTYTEYQSALYQESTTSYSLLQYVEARNENIEAQLSGELPSTNNGLGNIVTGSNNNIPNMPQGGIGGLPIRDNGTLVTTPLQDTMLDDNSLSSDNPDQEPLETSLILSIILGGSTLLGLTYFLWRKFD